ncbi:MAG: trigger factor [Pseudomonadales bacterium]|nr:trigger factor [Pseudomonadales bacterium]MCP5183982.1 trigger factor [Pseudomonadales bacterium]
MHISIETTTGLERRLTITVPSEEFEAKISEKLVEARGQVRLPGFRPGKVPMKEVRRRFGQGVRVEVAGELMQASFYSAVEQESLFPAGQPKLDVVKMDPGIDFEFTATFEVMPNVSLGDFSQVSVKQPVTEIAESDLDAMIQRLREQRKTFEPVERAAADGDKVTVDFEGRLDGEVFEGGKGEDVAFELGRGQMIEAFDAGVRGLTTGETKTFDATFPEDYRAENLAGKTVQFTVTVKSVAESRLPEMDDEFVKAFGVDEGGVEGLRKEVRTSMQRELDAKLRNVMKKQVLDELARLHDVQLPHALVHREIHNLKDRLMGQMRAYGAAAQGAMNLPDAPFEKEAGERVKLGLIMNAIIEVNDLKADQEKLDARLMEMAAGYEDPDAFVRYYRSQPEELRQVEMALVEDLAIDLVLGQAAVEQVTGSYDDVMADKLVPQSGGDETHDHEHEHVHDENCNH